MSSKLGSMPHVAERLARNAAAVATLTVLGAGRRVPEHVHANPHLSLHLLGSYRECGDGGQATIVGPAAMYFPSGSAHDMAVGEQGVALVIIEFDADRLRRAVGGFQNLDRPRRWVGGEVGRRASRLARAWMSGEAAEARRFAMTEGFLESIVAADQPLPRRKTPRWLERLDALIAANGDELQADRLARSLGVSRARLARAYREWRGEGLNTALHRRRVQTAAIWMEDLDLSLAQIASQAGFCDQSHMNRAFRRIVGRTPGAIRAARLGLSDPARAAG